MNMTEGFVVGAKQSLKAIKNHIAVKCFIANDADEKVTNEIVELCNNNNVPIVYVESMKELGKKFKINVGTATAVELK